MNRSVFHALRVSLSAQKDLLNETVSRCRKTELQPVVVFDLDGTVLDNRPRVSQIFHELGDHWATRLPAEAARLKATTPNDIGYGLKENLSRIGITDEAQTAGAILGHNFQSTDWYQDGYALLTKNGLKPESKGNNWLAAIYRQVIKGEWM